MKAGEKEIRQPHATGILLSDRRLARSADSFENRWSISNIGLVDLSLLKLLRQVMRKLP
jgi:hypothetical protein